MTAGFPQAVLLNVLFDFDGGQPSGRSPEWRHERMRAFQEAAAELDAPDLGEGRMRETVARALRLDAEGVLSLAEQYIAVLLACRVLERPDCPHDLLLLAVTHLTKLDETFPSSSLRRTVLARSDCPEEIRVAAALAGPAS